MEAGFTGGFFSNKEALQIFCNEVMQNHCLVMQMKQELTVKHSEDHELFARIHNKRFLLSIKRNKHFKTVLCVCALLGEGQTRQSKHFLQSAGYTGRQILLEGWKEFSEKPMNRYIELLLQAEREENFPFITEAPPPLPNPFFCYLLHNTRAGFQRKRFQQASYKNSFCSALQSELCFLLMVRQTVFLPGQTHYHSTETWWAIPGLAQDSQTLAGCWSQQLSALAFEILLINCFF